MLFRTHFIMALLIGILFCNILDYSYLIIPFILFFGVLPDIDTPFSKIGKRKILRPLQWFCGHRKIFHSFIFVFLISFGLFFISKFLMLGFLIGYSSHLLGDAFTIRGIYPIYPFNFRIKGFIKTGGFAELIIFVVCIVLISFILFQKYI